MGHPAAARARPEPRLRGLADAERGGDAEARQAADDRGAAPKAELPVRKRGAAPGGGGEVRARYEAGESTKAVASAIGVPADWVYRALKQWGAVRSKSEAQMVAYARRREAEDMKRRKLGPAGPETADEWERSS